MPWTPCVTSAWCPICPKTGTRLLIHLKHIKHYMGCDTALNSGGNELNDFKKQLRFEQNRCLGRQLTRCWDTAIQCDSTRSNITLISDRNEQDWVSPKQLLLTVNQISKHKQSTYVFSLPFVDGGQGGSCCWHSVDGKLLSRNYNLSSRFSVATKGGIYLTDYTSGQYHWFASKASKKVVKSLGEIFRTLLRFITKRTPSNRSLKSERGRLTCALLKT